MQIQFKKRLKEPSSYLFSFFPTFFLAYEWSYKNLLHFHLYVCKTQNLFGLLPVVDGQMRAVKLAEALKAKVVVPMNNGELDISESSWVFQVSCDRHSAYLHIILTYIYIV